MLMDECLANKHKIKCLCAIKSRPKGRSERLTYIRHILKLVQQAELLTEEMQDDVEGDPNHHKE